MQVALSLQYFPADGHSAPVTVHTSLDAWLLREFKHRALDVLQRQSRTDHADAVANLIGESEHERLRTLLDVLIPEDGR